MPELNMRLTIDWMRKLMLVEVYKNESEGYEVHLNGNITHTD